MCESCLCLLGLIVSDRVLLGPSESFGVLLTYSSPKVTYTYSDLKMTYSDPRVTYSHSNVTYSDLKVTFTCLHYTAPLKLRNPNCHA